MRLSLGVVVALTLGATSVAIGQGRVSGVVRDSTGAAIVGVEVSVQGVARPAVTGRQGEFQVSGVAAGTVVVSARRLGYAPYSTIIRVTNGETKVVDVVMIAVTRELDTVTTRDQQLWREYPLLREFEDHRKMGLGQFVTREQLARMQGGSITPLVNQMRGLIVVRSTTTGTHTWLANKYIPGSGCVELEDRLPGEKLSPLGADCGICYPQVYLDRTRISTEHSFPNISSFSPDQLQAMEIFLGAAETPDRYAMGRSACGVIILHSRVPDPARRVARRDPQIRTRSHVFANVSTSAAAFTRGCVACAKAASREAMLGYTIKDRVVIGGRYSEWSTFDDGSQHATLRHLIVEWYPDPEPGRFKWFVTGGAGGTWVSLNTDNPEFSDSFDANGLPSIIGGTGADIAVRGRFVVTPFLSHDRTIGGRTINGHCKKITANNGTVTSTCGTVRSQPIVFAATQLGLRFGWR